MAMENIWGRKLEFPDDLFYSRGYLWVKVESGHKMRVGLSDLAVKAVKDLLYIEIQRSVGTQVKEGDILGVVETSKSIWEIIAPVSGIVTAVNPELLQGNPAVIEEDPYGGGWIIEVEGTSAMASELEGLLRGEEAKEWIKQEAEANVPLIEAP